MKSVAAASADAASAALAATVIKWIIVVILEKKYDWNRCYLTIVHSLNISHFVSVIVCHTL